MPRKKLCKAITYLPDTKFIDIQGIYRNVYRYAWTSKDLIFNIIYIMPHSKLDL